MEKKALPGIRPAAVYQPRSTGNGKVVLGEVIKDLEARAIVGEKKHGSLLRTDNGRYALMDAYQEALDLCMYLKQELMEREDTLSC